MYRSALNVNEDSQVFMQVLSSAAIWENRENKKISNLSSKQGI